MQLTFHSFAIFYQSYLNIIKVQHVFKRIWCQAAGGYSIRHWSITLLTYGFVIIQYGAFKKI